MLAPQCAVRAEGFFNYAKLMMKYSFIYIICLLFAFSGCTSPRLEREVKYRPIGRAFVPGNVYTVGDMPIDIKKVLYLPLTHRAGVELGDGV